MTNNKRTLEAKVRGMGKSLRGIATAGILGLAGLGAFTACQGPGTPGYTPKPETPVVEPDNPGKPDNPPVVTPTTPTEPDNPKGPSGTNRAPVFTTSAPKEVNEGGTYTYQARAADPDGDEIAYNLVTPRNAIRSGLPSANWLTIDSSSGLITGTAPSVDADKTYLVEIMASDVHGAPSSQGYAIMVKNSDGRN